MEPSALKLWSSAQQLLRTRLNSEIYNLWFAPLRAIDVNSEVVTLEVPNDFSGVWLQENYRDLIHDAIGQCTGEALRVEFVVGGAPEARHPLGEAPKPVVKKEPPKEERDFP